MFMVYLLLSVVLLDVPPLKTCFDSSKNCLVSQVLFFAFCHPKLHAVSVYAAVPHTLAIMIAANMAQRLRVVFFGNTASSLVTLLRKWLQPMFGDWALRKEH